MEEKIKVLLVDDEDRLCEITSKRLIKKGFDVTYTNSAEMALRILKDSPRDVVVLDIKMAGMDGITALNEIKGQYPDIQIIMLSAYGTKHSAMRALVREAFDFLAKPCDVEILASRIHDAYMTKHYGFKIDDKKAINIMTRLEELISISADITVKEAMDYFIRTPEKKPAWPLAIEDHPKVLLVYDEKKCLTGILTKMDIIRAIRPEYVSVSESSHEESYRFSSIFWSGFFSDRVSDIAQKKAGEIMSLLPPVISENSNLLEVAHLMWKESKRMLLVQDISKVVGVISDQDIFSEIAEVMHR